MTSNLAPILLVSACTSVPTPTPTPDVTPSAVQVKKEVPESRLRELPVGERAAVFGRLGCPEGDLARTGCEVCPRGLHPDGDEDDDPYRVRPKWRSRDIFELRASPEMPPGDTIAGAFALGDATHLLLYGGCALEGDTRLERTSEMFLVRGAELVGVLEDAGYHESVRECAMPRGADGRRHVLCVASRVSRGVESLELHAMHAPTGPDGAGEVPHRFVGAPDVLETQGEWSVDEDGNDYLITPDFHHLSFTRVGDLDGDGDDDIVMRRGVDERWHLIQRADGVFVGERVE